MDGKNHDIHLTFLIGGSFFTVLTFVLACFSISPVSSQMFVGRLIS